MKTASTSKDGKEADSPSHLIDARIAALADWRGETLARVRALIKEADPDMVEEVKWRKPSNAMRGVPVWSHAGIVCTGETYQDKVKLTFAKGAALDDPSGLFNASLDGNTRRAIDLHEGDTIDAKAFKALIRAAVALNMSESCRSPHPLCEEAEAALEERREPGHDDAHVLRAGDGAIDFTATITTSCPALSRASRGDKLRVCCPGSPGQARR